MIQTLEDYKRECAKLKKENCVLKIKLEEDIVHHDLHSYLVAHGDEMTYNSDEGGYNYKDELILRGYSSLNQGVTIEIHDIRGKRITWIYEPVIYNDIRCDDRFDDSKVHYVQLLKNEEFIKYKPEVENVFFELKKTKNMIEHIYEQGNDGEPDFSLVKYKYECYEFKVVDENIDDIIKRVLAREPVKY